MKLSKASSVLVVIGLLGVGTIWLYGDRFGDQNGNLNCSSDATKAEITNFVIKRLQKQGFGGILDIPATKTALINIVTTSKMPLMCEGDLKYTLTVIAKGSVYNDLPSMSLADIAEDLNKKYSGHVVYTVEKSNDGKSLKLKLASLPSDLTYLNLK